MLVPNTSGNSKIIKKIMEKDKKMFAAKTINAFKGGAQLLAAAIQSKVVEIEKKKSIEPKNSTIFMILH